MISTKSNMFQLGARFRKSRKWNNFISPFHIYYIICYYHHDNNRMESRQKRQPSSDEIESCTCYLLGRCTIREKKILAVPVTQPEGKLQESIPRRFKQLELGTDLFVFTIKKSFFLYADPLHFPRKKFLVACLCFPSYDSLRIMQS